MATKVEFKRVQTDAEVENIDIKDGQLIYTGTGKTYMDYGTERIPTGSGGSSVEVDTEMSDTSENAVQNKVIKEYVDSKEEVIISDTQPIGDDWKLWIDSDEVGSQASEITNEYSTSTGLGYSANYVNNLHTHSTEEKRIGTDRNGKPLYSKDIISTLNNVTTAGTNVTTDISHNISNLEKLYIRDVYVNVDGRRFPLPFIEGNNGYVTICFPASNNASIRVRSNDTTFNGRTVEITVDYTKTTD